MSSSSADERSEKNTNKKKTLFLSRKDEKGVELFDVRLVEQRTIQLTRTFKVPLSFAGLHALPLSSTERTQRHTIQATTGDYSRPNRREDERRFIPFRTALAAQLSLSLSYFSSLFSLYKKIREGRPFRVSSSAPALISFDRRRATGIEENQHFALEPSIPIVNPSSSSSS